jgi:hypothetical protein
MSCILLKVNKYNLSLSNSVIYDGLVPKDLLKLPTTPCKNNCLVLAYSENPTDFPLVRSIFSKLVA